MNNLSQECIKAITVHEECYYQDYCENRNTKIRSTFMVGATEALTNPEIYEKAGLVSFEGMDKFLKWKRIYIKSEAEKALRSDSVEEEKEIFVRLRNYTNAQLFQIYKQHNP